VIEEESTREPRGDLFGKLFKRGGIELYAHIDGLRCHLTYMLLPGHIRLL
jgi:hypothetical protein